ncbi:MAG: STAS-like domain-containing protein [Planctomycetota bacterium]
MKTHRIHIAEDFSPTPGARYRSDGPDSGQQFREEKLIPLLKSDGHDIRIIVVLDGVYGFATSFLEEAFGGLAREIGVEECLRIIEIVSDDDPQLVDEVDAYIRDARLET